MKVIVWRTNGHKYTFGTNLHIDMYLISLVRKVRMCPQGDWDTVLVFVSWCLET